MIRLLGIVALIAGISPLATAQFTEGFKVPAGDAPWAVNEWSRQSDVQVLFDYTDLSHYQTQPLYGVYEAAEGLRRMLIDCPFDVAPVNPYTLAVVHHHGSRVCRPWMGAAAPLPPCVQEEVI